MKGFKLDTRSIKEALQGTSNVKGGLIIPLTKPLVARRLARSGVPALTVHDEFIVPEGMEDIVRDFMYSTGFQKN
jgi:hypothetical protein